MCLGISYGYKNELLVEFDSVLDFTSRDSMTPSYQGGIELMPDPSWGIRAGGYYDGVIDSTYVSGGLSLASRKVALAIGVRQQLEGGSDTLIAVTLDYFVK